MRRLFAAIATVAILITMSTTPTTAQPAEALAQRPSPSVVRDARPIPDAEVVSRVIAEMTPKERAKLKAYLDAVHRAAVWRAIVALHAQWAAWLRAVAPPPTWNVQSMVPCDGAYPPCWRKRIESGGWYNAVNRTGCSGRGCYGAWQFDPRTWAGIDQRLGGQLQDHPYGAPPWQQDLAAKTLWDGGRGCGHWNAC